jgi:3-deoxy-7-phosphoheptulonate synthase
MRSMAHICVFSPARYHGPVSDVLRPTIPVPPMSAEESAVSSERRPLDLSDRRPYLVFVSGPVRPPFLIESDDLEIGRRAEAQLQLDEPAISRTQAYLRRTPHGTFVLEDASSMNRTLLNGEELVRPTIVRDGDRLQFGTTLVKFVLHDEAEERHQRALYAAAGMPFQLTEAPTSTRRVAPWGPETWQTKPLAQGITYDDQAHADEVVKKLRRLPPLVTSWEIEELKSLIADAQDGGRFLLQGGDCAETLDECEPERIAAKLKILIQMSVVLIRSAKRPVIRVGRFAGQYAKPRSSPTETRDGVELPSYFGDLINRADFSPSARRPDPQLLVTGYLHAAVTLNFIRSLLAGGLSDLRRPEYFDLSYFERADLSPELSKDYRQMCREISDGINFVRSFGTRPIDDMMKVSFFASHEGLNLIYEAAQTRRVPRRTDFYDLTTHLPWIGERTRALDGAHIEFFRGVANPIAIKLGPRSVPEETVDLCKVLNPRNEPGKLVLIPRMGAKHVAERLPPLLTAIQRARRRVLWVCDPMHGNATTTRAGIKTRSFDDILAEVEASMDVHKNVGTYFGGVHFELTGDDVTECIGAGVGEDDLSRNYETLCDPRLNYRQALQMAFSVGRRLADVPHPSSIPPPIR